MNLHLVDRSPELVREWKRAFGAFPEVEIELGDILQVAHTALVSPPNSYGYMNGGIDLAYRTFFGIQIEYAVQAKIAEIAGPYLPVGQAILVETGHGRIPFLISAPTMFLPEPTDADSCEKAMAAALGIARTHGSTWEALFCPGLGTGVGCVAPRDAAGAMATAYRRVSTRQN
jgi:O-acetyl-ADP-ribose deacetylase (regulator of RNase III)